MTITKHPKSPRIPGRLRRPEREATIGRMAKPLSEPDKSRYSGRIAARVRQLRLAKNMSLDDFAARLLASGQADIEARAKGRTIDQAANARVRHYESGRAAIPPDLYPVIAKILGVTIHELLPPK